MTIYLQTIKYNKVLNNIVKPAKKSNKGSKKISASYKQLKENASLTLILFSYFWGEGKDNPLKEVTLINGLSCSFDTISDTKNQ